MTLVERVKNIINNNRGFPRKKLAAWARIPEKPEYKLARWITIRNVCARRAKYHRDRRNYVAAELWKNRRLWAGKRVRMWKEVIAAQQPPPPPPSTYNFSPGSPYWGAAQQIMDRELRPIGRKHGIRETSGKRGSCFGNCASDHHTSQLLATALNWGVGVAYWLAREMQFRLVGNTTFRDYAFIYFYRGGKLFRAQGIAATHGTGPHLHWGIRRVS